MTALVNLILQIVMFLIIILGLIYKKKRKFKIHGAIMGIAIILHLISFFAVMGPSFYGGYEFLTIAISDLGVQAIWIHAVSGAIAMTLGMVLVVAWAFNTSNIAACSRRKRIMDITTILWLVSLIFGILAYLIFTGSSLLAKAPSYNLFIL